MEINEQELQDWYAESLMHFGVPGMKWGRRKARPVGNGRRGTTRKKSKRVNPSTLTNKELKKRIERQRMENEYSRLTKQNSSKAGKIVVGAVASVATAQLIKRGNILTDQILATLAKTPAASKGAEMVTSLATKITTG